MKRKKNIQQKETLAEVPFGWRVHTPNLLNEVISGNTGGWVFKIPMQILGDLLYQVGQRAAQINDTELNALMARLTIYSMADPKAPDFDQEKLNQLLIDAENAKRARLK